MPLTSSDIDSTHRCDSCGAQAYVVFVLTESARELLFCGNHWEKNKPLLEDKGVWDDDALTHMRRAEQETVKV